MAEAFVNVTEGSGKKLHGWDRTVGANTVVDEFTLPGQYPYATYSIATNTISTATTASHFLQIMAGSSLNVYIRSIWYGQGAAAGAASSIGLSILRLTTAGNTGTAITPAPLDTADAASGATALVLPTNKGTESTLLYFYNLPLLVAPVAAPSLIWQKSPFGKGIKIAAGATNGIAFKAGTGVATSTIYFNVEIVELNY